MYEIEVPIWSGCRAIGLRRDRFDQVITIGYRDSKGKKVYPGKYRVPADATKYPTQMIKGNLLYLIPINDLIKITPKRRVMSKDAEAVKDEWERKHTGPGICEAEKHEV